MKWWEDPDFWFGLLMLWTLLGFLGEMFGYHIGWWRILGLGFPANPRYA